MFVSVFNKSMCRTNEWLENYTPNRNSRCECHFVKCHRDLYEWDTLSIDQINMKEWHAWGVVVLRFFCRFSFSRAILLHATFKCFDIMVKCSSNMHLVFEFNFLVFFLHITWTEVFLSSTCNGKKTTSFKRFQDSTKDSTHNQSIPNSNPKRENVNMFVCVCV